MIIITYQKEYPLELITVVFGWKITRKIIIKITMRRKAEQYIFKKLKQ
jgi:hypothetical protein